MTQFILTVVFGAIAGGLTNAVAVWMLFHPYEPPVLFGRRIRFLQGAIPKNKARLAAAIGRTVGTKLLTGEDLARTLREPSFRAAFDERLGQLIADLLETERGSLLESLPESVHGELRAALGQVQSSLLGRLNAYLATPEFRTAVQEWAATVTLELADRPLGSDLLTPEREAALTGAASSWIEDVVESDSFVTAIRDYVDRGSERLLAPGRTFEEVLPHGLVAALERAIAGYLPIAIEKLGAMLDDPGARARVERVLHELLDRFMADLKFHQRLVAALVITPETIDRVLRAIEQEGAGKISQLLHDHDVREAMARGVNNAVVEFLARDVSSVLGQPGDASVEAAKDTVTQWVLTLARDPQSRHFVIEKLSGMLGKAEQRTWGDVFKHLPPEKLADAITRMARSERANELYREVSEMAVDAALNRRLGRLAGLLAPGAAPRIQLALSAPLWQWLQEQVPPIAQRIDIARRVEQKILEFPTRQLELLIKNVTERELKLIVNLGYVLGAAIGLISAGLGALL